MIFLPNVHHDMVIQAGAAQAISTYIMYRDYRKVCDHQYATYYPIFYERGVPPNPPNPIYSIASCRERRCSIEGIGIAHTSDKGALIVIRINYNLTHYVVVKNTTNGELHALCVPAYISSVEAGVSWTFELAPSQYYASLEVEA